MEPDGPSPCGLLRFEPCGAPGKVRARMGLLAQLEIIGEVGDCGKLSVHSTGSGRRSSQTRRERRPLRSPGREVRCRYFECKTAIGQYCERIVRFRFSRYQS